MQLSSETVTLLSRDETLLNGSGMMTAPTLLLDGGEGPVALKHTRGTERAAVEEEEEEEKGGDGNEESSTEWEAVGMDDKEEGEVEEEEDEDGDGGEEEVADVAVGVEDVAR